MILEFKGKRAFLSNFYPSVFVWRDRHWMTAEHAYQAAKTDIQSEQEAIRLARTAGDAKRLGRQCTVRPGWLNERVDIMRELLAIKFGESPTLREMLLETGDQRLEEGNWWKDTFWGVCPVGSDNGKNMLGNLLMELRQSFIEDEVMT